MAFTYQSTVLIIGGTQNLGYYASLKLAKQFPNYQVVIASRSDRENAADSMNRATGQKNVAFMPLDLSSLASVRQFATTYASKKYPPITALLQNAGLQFATLSYSKDGFENTFATNHVGHALLFFLLREHLDSNARIIVTASGTHDPAQKTGMPDAIYNNAEELAHPTEKTAKFSGSQRYSTSKLCNVLWTYALDRRLRSASESRTQTWTVVAFDPGLMPGTGLLNDFNPVIRFVWKSILPRILPLMRLIINHNIHTPEESGTALARLAAGEDVKGVSGRYYEGFKEIKSSKDSYSTDKQDDLWDWTLKNISENKEEQVKFEKL